MLMEPEVKAGVIWAGAVYSYDDLVKYAISDPSFTPNVSQQFPSRRMGTILREAYGQPNTAEPYWQAVSLTEHIDLLENPIQLHHAVNDDVVNVGYSYDLSRVLADHNKYHEMYDYDGGGHNINSPYFEEAMRRTILFFQTYL
jgi:dienelactone hydrolase